MPILDALCAIQILPYIFLSDHKGIVVVKFTSIYILVTESHSEDLAEEVAKQLIPKSPSAVLKCNVILRFILGIVLVMKIESFGFRLILGLVFFVNLYKPIDWIGGEQVPIGRLVEKGR